METCKKMDEVKSPSQETKTEDIYSAAGNNLVRASESQNPMMTFLLDAHDWYYDEILRVCTPFCARMPREVHLLSFQLTIFTANIVTYARGLLVIPIALLMKYDYFGFASFLIMFHDFLDHLDGVVAKQQAKDGRSKGDDSVYGAFIDAQMDKLVFCLSMWTFLLFIDYESSEWMVNSIVILSVVFLIALECCIATIRCTDYFQVKFSVAGDSLPAVRAVCEGKLKQKFESLGLALYCLCLPHPAEHPIFLVAGSICLWFAAYFSVQSLLAKRPDAFTFRSKQD